MRVNAERPRSGAVELALAFARTKPGKILALHPAYAFGVDPELLDPVLPRVGRGRMHGKPELSSVALVIGRSQNAGCRARTQLVGNGERIEQHELLPQL